MRLFRKKTRIEEAAPVEAAAPEALEEVSPSEGDEQADKPKPRRRRGTRGGRGRGKKKVEAAAEGLSCAVDAFYVPLPGDAAVGSDGVSQRHSVRHVPGDGRQLLHR